MMMPKTQTQNQEDLPTLGKKELLYMVELQNQGGKAIGLIAIGKKFDKTLSDVSKRWHNLQKKGLVEITGLSGGARKVVKITPLGQKVLETMKGIQVEVKQSNE